MIHCSQLRLPSLEIEKAEATMFADARLRRVTFWHVMMYDLATFVEDADDLVRLRQIVYIENEHWI